MNIIFDIDDTITNETGFMLNYAPAFLKNKYGIDAEVKNPNGYNVDEVYGLKDMFLEKGFSEEEAIAKSSKIKNSFWNKHFIKYMFYPIKKEAKDTLKKIKSKDNHIIFVSTRGKKTTTGIVNKLLSKVIVPLLTKMQLKINGIKYDKLILVKDNLEKQKVIEDFNASVVFDDSVEVLENTKYAIPACVNTPHNVNYEFKNEKVVRCDLDIDKIEEIIQGNTKKSRITDMVNKKFDDLTLYQKVFTETTYKLFRTCGKKMVIDTFKPLVIGKENLPTYDGPNVFVGNHRNVKDPLITIALVSSPTHFAALKRMFENNENIFGKVGKNLGTYVTTMFVKSVGALPIARPDENDYMNINFQTFKYMADYLKLNSSVAIYPEGTLNRNPLENGNILPLKSNQSFKIAENGNAIIRPVAIVWVPKEAGIENKVLIAFLRPIYTQGKRAKEISALWQESMQNAITSMNSIIDELVNIKNNKDITGSKDKVMQLSNQIKRL